MPYNYATAKRTLTEAETSRIVCIFLNMDQSVVSPFFVHVHHHLLT